MTEEVLDEESPGFCSQPSIPKIVPDTVWPFGVEHASQVADCVAHPVVAQFTFDCLTMLVEACRRERLKNHESINSFPNRGPPFLGKYDGNDRSDLLVRGPSTLLDELEVDMLSATGSMEDELTVITRGSETARPELDLGVRVVVRNTHPDEELRGKMGTLLECAGAGWSVGAPSKVLLDTQTELLVNTLFLEAMPLPPVDIVLTTELAFSNIQGEVVFKNEAAVLKSLSALAHLLKVRQSASLLLESFCDTSVLAVTQSLLVKNTLESLGIASERIIAVGLPLSLKTGSSPVNFKLVRL